MQQSIDNLLQELEDLIVKRIETTILLNDINEKVARIKQAISKNNHPAVGEISEAIKGFDRLRELRVTAKKPYFKDSGTLQKIDYILGESGKYKTVRQIVETVKELEGLTEDGSLIADYSWIISDQIKRGERYGRFKLDGKGQYLIGLLSWFQPDGSPKKEHIQELQF